MVAIRFWMGAIYMIAAGVAAAAPPGFVKTFIELDAPPVALAFDSAGVLFALENPAFESNLATLRTIYPDGTFGDSALVEGLFEGAFYAGGMAVDAFDPLNPRILITDNAGDGWLYAVDQAGNRQIVAEQITNIADVAVRSSGEIFVTTAAPNNEPGAVLQIDRATGAATPVLNGLGYGAGLDFDQDENLIVQDVVFDTFGGRLQRLPISQMPEGGLQFGIPETLVENMQSGYGLAVGDAGEIFTTGFGGLFRADGSEILFDSNGSEGQFAAAIAFDPGSLPFEGFVGPGGGWLAYTADGFIDMFVTLLTPAVPGDYDGDGQVDEADYATWQQGFASITELAADGSGNAIVDAADYVVWRKHASAATNLSTAWSLSVPEPSTSAGMILYVTLMIGSRLFRRVP
jgi:hypothetical protein